MLSATPRDAAIVNKITILLQSHERLKVRSLHVVCNDTTPSPLCSAVQSQQFHGRLLRLFERQALSAKEDPFRDELREWVFGREDFLRRMATLAEGGQRSSQRIVLKLRYFRPGGPTYPLPVA